MARSFHLILFLFTFFKISFAQDSNYFQLLEKTVEFEQDSVFVSAVQKMPYEVMVSNLDIAGQWLK